MLLALAADLKVCNILIASFRQVFSKNISPSYGESSKSTVGEESLREMREGCIEICCLHFWAKIYFALANICARHFSLLTFSSFCFLAFCFREFSFTFPFVFTLLGLLPIGLLAQMMRKNHINGSRAPFWHFACEVRRVRTKNCLTFSHSAGQLKRHNACIAAKSLTWSTCSGIFNLCAMRLHTLVCTLRTLCTLFNMQYACNKV